ncbi:MAG: hypothetical protein QMB38_00995 [Ascidiaceihabitans sp.]|jgi:hypothetical protein|tara:strand:- start:694 stop:1206 length:513 start_codon:yes stop_codon:yes gene_type:complete
MKSITYTFELKLIILALSCFFSTPAKADILLSRHSDVIFNCAQDGPTAYFCTNLKVSNPDIVLKLPRFERKKISTYVDAFRIMPSLTNLTSNTIRVAKIRLTLWDQSELSQDFIINQKLIPNSTSNSKLSYLIRSDVPAQAALYSGLTSISKKSSYNQIILELLEVKYKK